MEDPRSKIVCRDFLVVSDTSPRSLSPRRPLANAQLARRRQGARLTGAVSKIKVMFTALFEDSL